MNNSSGIGHKEFICAEIGTIPEDWRVARLIDLGMLQYGYTTSSLKENTGVKFLRITDISNEGRINWEGVPYCIINESDFNKYKLAFGDILFARIGATTGKTAFYDKQLNAIFASYLIRFQSSANNLDERYLYYYAQSNKYWDQVDKNKEAQLKKGLNAKTLGNIKVPLPPLKEQQKIAEILMTVDKEIEEIEELIKKTQRLKEGLMQNLLAKGIGHNEYKKTEIGKIPKSWRLEKLGKIAEDFIGGGTPSTKNPDFWDGDIPWMTSAHINKKEVISGQRYITKKGLKESATHLLPKGNLLIATRTGIGKIAINSIDIAISQDLTGVVVNKDKVSIEYLYWFLIKCTNRLQSLSQGSTIKRLLKEELSDLIIAIPELEEQHKIAKILDAVDTRLQLLRNKKEKLERIKKGLMNDLLTGRKRILNMIKEE